MAELQANPVARELLLLSVLTQEFLGLPARMEAAENRREGVEDRLIHLEEAVTHLVETLRQMDIDVAYPRGMGSKRNFIGACVRD